MQIVSSIEASAYLKVITEKNLLNAFILLIFKPLVLFVTRKISLKNFSEIIKYKNIKILFKLFKNNDSLFIKINE